MANPRQRRKARSSSYRPVLQSQTAKRNLKKIPPIRGPKALQDAWNRHKTLKQNYVALGLMHTLTPSTSGGIEPSKCQEQFVDTGRTSNPIPRSKSPVVAASIPQGFGKIVRDDSGNVMRVELPLAEDVAAEKHDDSEHLRNCGRRGDAEKWCLGLSDKIPRCAENAGIVDVLEQISAPIDQDSRTLSVRITGVGPRASSVGERRYLDRLVAKYGLDVGKMTRDPKLNPDQRTAGQLWRALKKAGFGREGREP